MPVTEPGGPEGRNERDEPHEEEAGDQATAEEEEEQDSGEWAAEEEWRRREQCRERTYDEDDYCYLSEASDSDSDLDSPLTPDENSMCVLLTNEQSRYTFRKRGRD